MADDYKEWLKRAKSNLEIAKHSKTENVCYKHALELAERIYNWVCKILKK